MKPRYAFDPSLQIGDIDTAWNARFVGAYPVKETCRQMVPAPKERSYPYHCTLLKGHTGPCIAHSESSGKVLGWAYPPIRRELQVSEGL